MNLMTKDIAGHYCIGGYFHVLANFSTDTCLYYFFNFSLIFKFFYSNAGQFDHVSSQISITCGPQSNTFPNFSSPIS